MAKVGSTCWPTLNKTGKVSLELLTFGLSGKISSIPGHTAVPMSNLIAAETISRMLGKQWSK